MLDGAIKGPTFLARVGQMLAPAPRPGDSEIAGNATAGALEAAIAAAHSHFAHAGCANRVRRCGCPQPAR